MAFSEQDLNENQRKIAALISAKAEEMGVDRDFALAVAHAESRLRQFDEKNNVIMGPPPKKKYGERAVGIMQVLPSTAKDYGFSPKDLRDPEKNITAGVTYLKHLIEKSEGDKATAAAMYNWGPGNNFFRTGQGELPTETINYLKHIKSVGGLGEGEPSPNEPKVEPIPTEPKQPVEVEPTPNEATPEATIHQQDVANPAEDAQKNKEMATATGAVLGAGVGFAKSRINAAENKAMREEMARIRAQQQMARLNPQPAAPAAPVQPTARPGALPTAQGSPQLKGAQKWVQSLGNQVPYAIAEQAETMDKVRATGGQSLLNKDAEAMAKIRGMGEGRFQLTGEGRGQMMLPPGVADQAAQQQAQAAANEERLARIAADTERARMIRLQQEEANRPMNRARAALTSLSETPVGQIGSRVARTAFQRFPVVGYGAASASMGRNVAEVDEAMRNKEYIDALLAASQLAATGASMVPALAPVAFPAALGLEAVKQARDYYR
jgi:hypothetical protein